MKNKNDGKKVRIYSILIYNFDRKINLFKESAKGKLSTCCYLHYKVEAY